MKKAALLSLLLLCGCSDPQGATRALDDLGFKGIEITGYRWFGCQKDYNWHTGFKALNPNGKTVTGQVCSGWFLGQTVKFD